MNTKTTEQDPAPYPEDIHTIRLGDRTIFLVGTAHISRESVELVRQVIAQEKPDCVCIELDEKRYEAISKKNIWENLNLKELIYKRQLSTLIANLILAAYQKKLGDQLGVMPGTELLEAAKTAKEYNIPIALCDRDVRVTLRRTWNSVSFWKKNYLLASLITSLFDTTELTEEKLTELKKLDVISGLIQELGTALPELKVALIDERDTFLAEKIKAAKGERLVAVVGAGHVAGIKQALLEDRSASMAEYNTIPPASKIWKFVGWSIPATIIASLAWIAWEKGPSIAGDYALFWVAACGIPSCLGAVLALSHPLTIASAFAAAPITTLSPVIGVGHVTALVQVLVQPPLVREFETVLDDIGTFSGWWRNRLLKVFLAFLLPGLGGMIGVWIGGYEIISNMF